MNLAEKYVAEEGVVLLARKKCSYCGASGTPEQMRLHMEIRHLTKTGRLKSRIDNKARA